MVLSTLCSYRDSGRPCIRGVRSHCQIDMFDKISLVIYTCGVSNVLALEAARGAFA